VIVRLRLEGGTCVLGRDLKCGDNVPDKKTWTSSALKAAPRREVIDVL